VIYLKGWDGPKLELLLIATEDLMTSRCFMRSRKQCDIVYLSHNRRFVHDIDNFLVEDTSKTRMYHRLDAPNGIGERYLVDFMCSIPWASQGRWY